MLPVDIGDKGAEGDEQAKTLSPLILLLVRGTRGTTVEKTGLQAENPFR